jgi:hypothetical protein
MESISRKVINHSFVRETTTTALRAMQKLPTGSYVAGGLLLAWLANKWYSDRALNNATTAKFDWNKEIVVVTGGSGGIGGEVVKTLASKGVTVVVIDILALTYPKRKPLPGRLSIRHKDPLTLIFLTSFYSQEGSLLQMRLD